MLFLIPFSPKPILPKSIPSRNSNIFAHRTAREGELRSCLCVGLALLPTKWSLRGLPIFALGMLGLQVKGLGWVNRAPKIWGGGLGKGLS